MRLLRDEYFPAAVTLSLFFRDVNGWRQSLPRANMPGSNGRLRCLEARPLPYVAGGSARLVFHSRTQKCFPGGKSCLCFRVAARCVLREMRSGYSEARR